MRSRPGRRPTRPRTCCGWRWPASPGSPARLESARRARPFSTAPSRAAEVAFVRAAAALSALLHFLDRPTVDLLRQVLGLTSSGTVRLVDRMAESGYVRRGPGPDGRSTSISLTGAGRAAAEQVAAARTGVLLAALGGLSPAERETLRELMSKLLAGLIRGPGAVRWMCRLCDTGVCRGTEGGCPVGNAVRERYAVHGGGGTFADESRPAAPVRR